MEKKLRQAAVVTLVILAVAGNSLAFGDEKKPDVDARLTAIEKRLDRIEELLRQFGVVAPSFSNRDAPAQSSAFPSAPPQKTPSPVLLALTAKGFKPRNIHAEDFEDDITLELSIRNVSGRDIRAFDGILHFTDLLDNEILAVRFAFNNPIAAGATTVHRGSIEYNQFVDAHKRLRAEEQANLKIVFVPRKILFADGTSQVFSEQ
jgi:hypothetical protein